MSKMPDDLSRLVLDDEGFLTTEELKRIIKQEISRWLNAPGEADLPMLPHVAAQAMRLMNSPNASIAEVAKLIEQDQLLAGRLIKMANSPVHRTLVEITALPKALLLIGLRGALDLVFSVSVQGRVFRHKRYGERMKQMWRHSLGCACIAQELARVIRANYDIAFLFGLLHDIGKPLIIDSIAKLAQQRPDQISLQHIDDALLDEILDEFHCPVGGLIARKWGLPEKIHSSIANHHQPFVDGRWRRGALVTGVADLFCHRYGIGTVPVDRDLSDHEWLKPFELDAAACEALDERLREGVGKFLTQFEE
jgi:putative nucleotidyltransferase with HDIG domain